MEEREQRDEARIQMKAKPKVMSPSERIEGDCSIRDS